MSEVTLSSKNMIVVPREALEAVGLQPGAKLDVVARGDAIILIRRARGPAESLRGIGAGLYGRDYLDRERGAWKARTR